MSVSVPSPSTQGYINLADGLIMAASMAFGPAIGALSAAAGSAAADLLLGYAHWAPFTFVIKGLMAACAGYVGRGGGWKSLVAAFLGAAVMVGGYYFAGCLLYGPAASLLSVWPNAMQGAAGIAVSAALRPLLEYAKKRRGL